MQLEDDVQAIETNRSLHGAPTHESTCQVVPSFLPTVRRYMREPKPEPPMQSGDCAALCWALLRWLLQEGGRQRLGDDRLLEAGLHREDFQVLQVPAECQGLSFFRSFVAWPGSRSSPSSSWPSMTRSVGSVGSVAGGQKQAHPCQAPCDWLVWIFIDAAEPLAAASTIFLLNLLLRVMGTGRFKTQVPNSPGSKPGSLRSLTMAPACKYKLTGLNMTRSQCDQVLPTTRDLVTGSPGGLICVSRGFLAAGNRADCQGEAETRGRALQ